jgi:WD40 repeat protein
VDNPERDYTKAAWTSSGLLVTGTRKPGSGVDVWSLPEARRVRTIEFEHPGWWQVRGDGLMVEEVLKFYVSDEEDTGARDYLLRSWSLPDGEARTLGQVFKPPRPASSHFTRDGAAWLYHAGREVFLYPLPIDGRGPRRLQGDIEEEEEELVWTLPPGGEPVKAVLARPEGAPAEAEALDPAGRWFATDSREDRQIRLWDSSALPGARPRTLRRDVSWYAAQFHLTPATDWLVASTHGGERLTFWPLSRVSPIIVGYSRLRRALAFSPDGCSVATAWPDDSIRLYPLPGCPGRETRTIHGIRGVIFRIAFEPRGRYLVAAGGTSYLVPLDGRPPRPLTELRGSAEGAAVSPSGRRVASAWGWGPGEKELRLWDLETGESWGFPLPVPSTPAGEGHEGTIQSLTFASESVLLTAGDGGVRRWDVETGQNELVVESEAGTAVWMAASADRRTLLTKVVSPALGWTHCYSAELVRPADGSTRELPAFGDCVTDVALDPSGTLAATGDAEGVIRVGRIDGGDPHLLLGHEGPVEWVALSPDRRWVASTGEDDTLCLWPMPDVSQPPIHTWPHAELIAKLKSLTNLRVVRDPESAVGWTVELDRFPGWDEVPTWFTPSPEWSARMEDEGAAP